jgi:hypothetical protein
MVELIQSFANKKQTKKDSDRKYDARTDVNHA